MVQYKWFSTIIIIHYLLNDLTSKYRHVKFVNLSKGSLGIFGLSCDWFIQMCSDLTIDKAHVGLARRLVESPFEEVAGPGRGIIYRWPKRRRACSPAFPLHGTID